MTAACAHYFLKLTKSQTNLRNDDSELLRLVSERLGIDSELLRLVSERLRFVSELTVCF